MDNAIEFADTSLGCLKFLFALTKVALGLLLGLLCYKPYELVFVFSCIRGDPADILKEKLFNDHVADLVGAAFAFLLSVCSANEVFLAMLPASTTYLVELCTTIGAEKHTR